jgi:hypothetical protein
MTTPWAFPSNISQFSESGAEEIHISWNDANNLEEIKSLDSRSIQSNGSLYHIARSPKKDLKNKTYFIRATGFNFQNLPNVLSGIELKINTRRYGRATDDTIQLCLNGSDIGDNKATLEIKPEKTYGGNIDLWSTENISIDNVRDPTFGITIRFKAHPNWPHKDPIMVDSVEMRIH